MAGPATTGNTFLLNNMEGRPLPMPATASLQPQEEVSIWMQLQMMQGMDGPHHFRLRIFVAGEGGEAYPTLEIDVRAFFG